MTSHPDVEALAFFAEDLLEPDEERSIADHIDTCATCAATIDELSGVTRVLAEAPAPALPQDVADLLDGHISEAARERSAASGPTGTEKADAGNAASGAQEDGPADAGPVGTPATVTPITARRRSFGLPKLMVAAAAAVFVVGGGAAVFNGLMAEEEDTGAASPMIEENSGPESEPDTAQSYTAEAVESETVYTADQLGEQASAVQTEAEAEGAEGSDPGVELQAQDQLPDGAQDCVTQFEEANGTRVTLVDDALFDDGTGPERAWILFTQDTNGTSVAVVDPSCAQGGDTDDNVIAEGTL